MPAPGAFPHALMGTTSLTSRLFEGEPLPADNRLLPSLDVDLDDGVSAAARDLGRRLRTYEDVSRAILSGIARSMAVPYEDLVREQGQNYSSVRAIAAAEAARLRELSVVADARPAEPFDPISPALEIVEVAPLRSVSFSPAQAGQLLDLVGAQPDRVTVEGTGTEADGEWDLVAVERNPAYGGLTLHVVPRGCR